MYLTAKKRKLKGWKLDGFNRFWAAWALPKGKAAAADSWLNVPGLSQSMVEEIVAGARIEAAARDRLLARGGKPKWAQGWLTERRWEDLLSKESESPQGAIYDTPDAAMAAMGHMQ